MTLEFEQLKAELEAVARPERAEQEKRYLKSELRFLGAGLPAIRAAAKRHRAKDREALVHLCAQLWATDVHELHAVACVLLEIQARLLEPQDLPWLCGLLRSRGR